MMQWVEGLAAVMHVLLTALGALALGAFAGGWIDVRRRRKAVSAHRPIGHAITPCWLHEDLEGLDPREAFELGINYHCVSNAIAVGAPMLAQVRGRNAKRIMTLCIRLGRVARIEKMPGDPDDRLLRVDRRGAKAMSEELLTKEVPWLP